MALKMPWDENGEPENGQLVHLQEDELRGLIEMQGEEDFTPSGFPSFEILGEKLEDPEFKEIVKEAIEAVMKDLDLAGDENAAEISESFDAVLPWADKSPQEKKGPVHELEQEGTHGDTRVAWLPYNLIEILLDAQDGQAHFNEETGLLMFGIFGRKGIFGSKGPIMRTVGRVLPVVGHILGGALGAGAGRFLGGQLRGESAKKSFSHALGNAGKSLAFHTMMGGNPLQGIFGQQGGMPGFNGGQGGGNPLSNLFNMGGQQGNQLPGGGREIPSISANNVGVLKNASEGLPYINGGGPTPGRGIPGEEAKDPLELMKSIFQTALPMVNTAMAYKSDKRKYKQERREYDEARAEQDRILRRYEAPLHVPTSDYEYDPGFYDMEPEDYAGGVFMRDPFKHVTPLKRAHGGPIHAAVKTGELIKGPGKGQDDLIYTKVRPNTYIGNADFVSHVGDGSSEAGAKILRHFEEQIRRLPGAKKYIHKDRTADGPSIDVALSDGEYPFEASTVDILGKGSNKAGAKVLDNIRVLMRKERAKAKGGMPPKARDMMYYLKKVS